MSVVISIRVPKELKKKMEKIPLNWSKFIRESIQRKIMEIERQEAAAKIDMIRKKTRKGVFNAAQSIRSDRDSL